MSSPAKVRRLIRDGGDALAEVMKLGLADISSDIIDKVMRNYRNSTKSNQVNSIKNITISGIGEYKKIITEAIAEITTDSLELARKEVPKSKIKLTR